MAAIKCKMCGGDLTFTEGATVAECEYCGSKQTIPNQDNEKKLTLFARADRLRRACEFDKAAGVYESIVADFPEEAEAYWGLVLCRYGIEYVDDPATGKKVPTCHRSSFDSILEDTDFDQACENADVLARKVYRDEAKQIEDIRKGILEVSGKEEPYDIFICYKETDENGDRTVDSAIAQDVYDALTEKGYRVFFSRISLEDKLGTEYEPYIFAALNSAKIMLVFGTDYEYFNAVWVKNEWSRFLSLIAAGQKKTLIPCYKGVDAYDMPKEFAKLQAQDMGKVGAIQDLLRGIEKIMGVDAIKRPQEVVIAQSEDGSKLTALLKRGYMALEDGEWDAAAEFFNRVLDMDAESAPAYLGMAMAQAKCQTEETFKERYVSATWKDDKNTTRAKRYAASDLQKKFENWDAEKKAIAERKVKLKPLYKAYRERHALAAKRICVGDDYLVGLNMDGTVITACNNEHGQFDVGDWTDIVAISAKSYKTIIGDKYAEHIAGLRVDGTVVAVGNNESGQQDVSGWTDIVAVAACDGYIVGLKADGTALFSDDEDEECTMEGWTDIVAVAAYDMYTVGLKADGTVVATDDAPFDEVKRIGVWDWTDIVAVAGGISYAVGLKADGTVVAVSQNFTGRSYAAHFEHGQCEVGDWADIVAIAAGGFHTVGLKADGTVVAVGDNRGGQCDVGDWADIVAIAAGTNHTVGLKADGTVVAVGYNGESQREVDDWTDIVAIAARLGYTVGLRADGTVVNTEYPDWTRDWKLFNSIDTLEQEIADQWHQGEQRRQAEKQHRQEKKQRQEEERQQQEEAQRRREEARRHQEEQRRSALEKERAALYTELSGLKGLFTGKRRQEIETRLGEIKAELLRLWAGEEN